MNDSGIILEMRNVSKRFQAACGEVEALRRVNLTIAQREFVAITGPSGSGKSTFLHLAALLDTPTSGSVIFDGLDTANFEEPNLCHVRKRKIGMVFQKYCLLPHRSVYENVLFRFRYVDHDRDDAERRVMRTLEFMGLDGIAERTVRLLSGGEMQRVAIARAIAFEPILLIADEPTGNLDKTSARDVMDCFGNLNQAGITVVMVTHNEALLKFCTRHLTCEDGVIEADQ